MKKNFFVLIFLCIFLSSCVTLREKHDFVFENEFDYIPNEFVWDDVTDEIKYSKVELPESPLIYHLVRIDFSSTDIQIVDYVSDKKENKNKGMLVDKFGKETGAVVCINTSPFNVDNRLSLKCWWLPSKFKNAGIHISEGEIFSPAVEKYSALAFFVDRNTNSDFGEMQYRAEIFEKQTDFKNAEFVFGGFYSILRDGKKQNFPSNIYDSRTAVGISEDGKILYLLVVEGENQKKSIGLSYPYCADIFLALGCDDAMQFDGGGSSGMYVNGKNVMSYKPCRKTASLMGIKIQTSP